MSKLPQPCEDNEFLFAHVALMRASLRHLTGRELVNRRMGEKEAARFLWAAPFAVVSHDTAKDPIFTYANQTALSLFGMNWRDLTSLPSRLSAEPDAQADRDRLLQKVSDKGFIEDYRGVRVGRHGRRFLIEGAVVWNLIEPRGGPVLGQAALFKAWKFL